ncbi:F-box/kelch-repeat protein At3g17530-like [Brassica napus]|nr:F-box/kelch-repeat protein At3g17530-like [Brassica napus]XP_048594896.1 F-box/kelch-repeat protein At3g17530-like [Brassica napus]XP_048627199.1 F-box/kelch-repeat protein At3g17530-like [Brassica napus]
MILANLPHDLESEILARVPAKSLSQLKTTCKRWYALFNLMRIWVSNKVDEEGKELSWRKDFVLEVDFDKFQLPCEVNVASFLLNEEKKVAVFCETKATKGEEQTRIYIAGEGMYKQVCKEGSVNVTRLSYPLLLTYVPSLVCIH